MPLFEFKCETCQHQFEELVRGSEKPACPSCGSQQLDRLFSAPAAPSTSGLPTVPSAAPMGHSCGPGCCRHG
jgi:putative FmdB family regulatory protein